MPKRGEKPIKRCAPSVVQLQLLCSAVLVLLALLCRLAAPEPYAALRQQYLAWFDQQDLEPQLARFANAVGEAFALPAYAEAETPWNASEKPYLPRQRYVLPVEGASLSSGYGWRDHPVTEKESFHTGVDLACAEGTPVCAAMAGMVEYTLYDASGGNTIRLRHADGVETAYCHLQYSFVRAGESVTAGQVIGTVGSTGNATGPHLHFALLCNDSYYDPTEMLGLGAQG